MKNKAETNRFADPKKLLLSPDSPFSVQEAYKTLRTNVTFSLPDSGGKCIGVVSATRGEGKSTISVNLAISLAQLNKRVVLVDCDMRLPTIVTKLGVKMEEGLSDYLSGMTERIPIYRVESRGIDVIPSGTIPPDSTILIESKAMTELLQFLKEEYDYVVLDFPPINIVSDAVLLSNQMDGYLMVIRHKYSEHKKLNEAIRQMKFSEAKIIGFVYNGKGNERKYYKKSSYYYKNNYYYYKKS